MEIDDQESCEYRFLTVFLVLFQLQKKKYPLEIVFVPYESKGTTCNLNYIFFFIG